MKLASIAIISLLVSSSFAATAQTRRRATPRKATVKLTAEQKQEVREIFVVIDAMESSLSQVWTRKNDFGVPSDADREYAEGAANTVIEISKRFDNVQLIPEGEYKKMMFLAIMAYADVGRLRVAGGEQGGEDLQSEIASRYGLEKVAPNLRAYALWQLARKARNLAALQVGIPIRKFNNN